MLVWVYVLVDYDAQGDRMLGLDVLLVSDQSWFLSFRNSFKALRLSLHRHPMVD
jgi:hypothetical protein